MNRRPATALIALVVLLTTAAACTSTSAPTSAPSAPPSPVPTSAAPPAAPTAKPAPRPPRRGCYALSWQQAVAPTTSASTRVNCAEEHTSVTYHVGVVPAVINGHLVAVDSNRVQTAISQECPRRLQEYVGGDPQDLRLSMIRAIWFSPSLTQSDRGHDWFRCDATVLRGRDRLAPINGSLEGALDQAGWQARYGVCGTANPQSANFQRVICSADHSWEAISTVDAAAEGDNPPYPRIAALRSAGSARCETPARAAAADPFNVSWSYEPPTRAQWMAGQHYGTCWVPSS